MTRLLRHHLPALLLCYARYGASLYTVAAWTARRTPSALALVATEPGGSRTFAELCARANQWAGVLAAQPVGKVRRVGILCRNHAVFVEVLLACGRLGIEALLLHTSFTAEQLQSRTLDLLVCDREFEALAIGQNTIFTDRPLPETAALVRRQGRASITILTSGTTGVAKPVRRKPGLLSALRSAKALLEKLTLQPAEPTLLTLPLLHGHGLATLSLSLALGSPLFLFPKATAQEFLHCIETNQIKVLVLVPTILYRLLQESPTEQQVRSVRVIVCGSAPLSGTLATHALECFGPTLFNLYGSSEAGVISLATPADLAAAPESVGRPLPGVQVRILGRDNREAPPNTLGWVCVQGEQVVGGKLFETGDQGRLDTEGRLYLHGRTDDLLICGGENVFPQTIEATICQSLKEVQECAAVGIPDAEFGQAIVLFVVLKPDTNRTPEGLLEAIKPLFPRALRPRAVTLVPELPRTLAGKLIRGSLADRLAGL